MTSDCFDVAARLSDDAAHTASVMMAGVVFGRIEHLPAIADRVVEGGEIECINSVLGFSAATTDWAH